MPYVALGLIVFGSIAIALLTTIAISGRMVPPPDESGAAHHPAGH